nr:hypothetical protein 2 [Bacillaceae bacterium]
MEYKEIEQLLQYSNYESKLFMPNEVFDDLKLNIKNTPHIAFAYTYLYLNTWLYRYTKHTEQGGISNSVIKEILGYKPETRTVNYLITKNGLLDKMGYTSTTRDFPIAAELNEGYLEFTLVNGLDNKDDPMYSYSYSWEKRIRDTVPKNFTIKYPVKAFHRTKESMDDSYEDGTFYEVENTHCIPFDVFMYCMSKKDIGCTGFYLYAYLKHQNDIHGGSYDVSLVDLALQTGIAERTLDTYLDLLKGYRLTDFIHNQEFFAVGLRKEDRKANTYITNDYEFFKDKPQPYERINIIKKKDYIAMAKKEEEEKRHIWGEKMADIPLEQLPY